MEPITFALAMILAFVSAIVGGMVGGSYLILIPALLFLGLDIHYVIGITKILTVALGLSFINYLRNGKVDLKFSSRYAVLIVIGGVIGSYIVIELDKGILQRVIAMLMVVIALFMLINKNFGVNPKKIKLGKKHIVIAVACFFVLGIYLGFYAAATSIFSIMIFTMLLRKDFVQAIGNARFLDLAGGVASAVVFASKGLIDYRVAVPMGIVYFVGAWLGSHITLKKGSAWVRYPLIIIALAFAVKLLFFS